MITLPLLQSRLSVEKARENYRYKQWWKWVHVRPQTPVTLAERQKWYGLYSDAKTKRISLEHEVREHTPKFNPATEASTEAVNFIKGFEGYVGHIYDDGTGVMTVGYGHIENVPGNGIWVAHQKQRFHLTEAEASLLLRQDLNKHYSPTIRNLPVKLKQAQFTGWLSFVYNCGVGAVGLGTEVGRQLHRGNQQAAANAMLQWCHAGGHVLLGLQRRREAERRLILKP